MRKLSLVVLMAGILVFISCGKKAEEPVIEEPAAEESGEFVEPDHLTIQHILISFDGAPRMEGITRTLEEAEELAKEILKRAQAGEDFDALVKEYTNDQHPGIYKMSNNGVTPDDAAGEFPRAAMVKAFGDVSFSLRINEIGMTDYSAETSPFGWHIIKRLE